MLGLHQNFAGMLPLGERSGGGGVGLGNVCEWV